MKAATKKPTAVVQPAIALARAREVRVMLTKDDAQSAIAALSRLIQLIEVSRLSVRAIDDGIVPDDNMSTGMVSVFETLSEARALYWGELSDLQFHIHYALDQDGTEAGAR